jgi:hypothetical protein
LQFLLDFFQKKISFFQTKNSKKFPNFSNLSHGPF